MKNYPLTNAQKRIWYAQKKHGGSSLFNIGGTVKINGNVNENILIKAICGVIESNTALRLQFAEKNNEAVQYVYNEISTPRFIDFSSENEPLKAYEKWCAENAQTPFNMENNPLYYFVVFKISDKEMGYFVKMHHIIADGWSMKLLTEQVSVNYEKIAEIGKNEIVEPPSYVDYVFEEDRSISDKAKKYWTEMFSPLPDISSVTSKDLYGKRKVFLIDSNIQNKIENYIGEKYISLNIFFTCVYFLYAYKKTGKRDVTLGIPFLGRTGRKERQIFGTFTNTMPYRFVIEPNEEIPEMLSELSTDLKKSYQHQKYPYNLLKDDLRLNENGIDRLFDICINYYNTVLTQHIGGCSIDNTEFYNGQQDYAMQIIIRHWKDSRVQLDFDYQMSIYTEKQIDDIYNQLMLIANQVIDNSKLKVKDILLVDEQDRRRFLFGFNGTKRDYPLDKTWVDLFEKIAEDKPDIVVVSHNDRVLSYDSLNQKSNGLARYFRNLGLRKGDVAAAVLEHNIESIIVITAIAKCGAVYLPIDRNTPVNRARDILKSSNSEFLITSNNNYSISDFNGTAVVIDGLDITEDSKNIRLPNPSDLAYLIYTSGSMGTPKGVMVSHGNLINYLWWAKDTYIRNTHEVFALYSSFAFDFTMTSIFLPLISGGEIRIYEGNREKNIFNDILNEDIATILKITPSHIPLINDVKYKNKKIHTFIAGGEDLKTESCKKLYRQFDGNVNIYNEYGPTEATVGCMTYLYKDDNEISVPIGKPIANTQIYLLDKDLQPVPYDTQGEIYISGESVSKGYLGLAEESCRRFISNPFIYNDTMYKTGDTAYRNESDDLVYSGRNDNEVKIRGNRVNLSEIENKAMSSDMVHNIAVKLFDNDNKMCAYIIKKENYSEEGFKSFLASNLHDYMIPQFIITLDKFPLTANGKLDKDKLPEPSEGLTGVTEHYDTKKLEILLSAIKEIIADEKVTADSNFYAIGGDSIKAIQISSRLNERGYEITVRDILTNPVIGNMSAYMTGKTKPSYEQGICDGEIKKIPILKWFFGQGLKNEGWYNQSLILKLKQDIKTEILEKAFLKLITHHDMLRLNYERETDTLFYNNSHIERTVHINEINLYDLKWSEAEKVANSLINKNFDLKNDLLIRIYKIKAENGEYLYLILHHLVTDGVSWRIILEDISQLLSQAEQNVELCLPQKTSSYQDYANEYFNFMKNAEIDSKFWNEAENCGSIFQTEYKPVYLDTKSLEFELSEATTENLLGKANEPYNTKANELLLISLVRTIKTIYGKNEAVIELEGHGRDVLEGVDVQRTVGWFTNIFPVYTRIGTDDLREQIKSVKDQIKKTSKRGYEYGVIGYQRGLNSNKKYVRFNYLGEYVEENNDFFSMERLFYGINTSPDNEPSFLIEINAVVVDKKLKVNVTYYDELNSRAIDFIYSYKNNIIEVVNHCMSTDDRIYTPSDFDMVDLTQEELDGLLE